MMSINSLIIGDIETHPIFHREILMSWVHQTSPLNVAWNPWSRPLPLPSAPSIGSAPHPSFERAHVEGWWPGVRVAGLNIPRNKYAARGWDLQKNSLVGGKRRNIYQVLPSDLFGCFKWPFQGVVGDLHLGDQKVTWKKLVDTNHEFFFVGIKNVNQFFSRVYEVQ